MRMHRLYVQWSLSIAVFCIPVSGYTGHISSAQTVEVPCKRYSIYRIHDIPADFCCVFGDRYRETPLYVHYLCCRQKPQDLLHRFSLRSQTWSIFSVS